MKLYRTSDSGYDWICFVFAKSRGEAKKLVTDLFGFPYTEARATIIAKETDITTPIIIDNEDHPNYADVLRYGGHYANEEDTL